MKFRLPDITYPLIFVATFLMFFLTPDQVDNLLFADYFEKCHRNLAEYISFVRYEENGRLTNIICGPWMVYLAKWLRAGLLALFTTAMLRTGAMLLPRRDAVPLLLWGAFAVLLPWRAGLFIDDITLNYVPVSAMLFLLVVTFLRPGGHIIGWSIFAFFTALMHEGADMVIVFAIGIYTLIHRFRLSRRQWAIICAYALGTAVLLSSYGIWAKFGASTAPTLSPKAVIMALPGSLLLGVALLLALIFRPGHLRALFKDSTFAVSCFAALGGAFVAAATGFGYLRSGWFGEGFALVAITWVVLAIFPRKIIAALCTLTAIALAIVYSSAICLQNHYRKEHLEILAAIDASPTGTVFRDLDPHCPKIALNYPASDTWLDATQLLIVNLIQSEKAIVVVPTVLAGFTPAQSEPLPGDAEAMIFGGEIIIPDRPFLLTDGQGKPYERLFVDFADFVADTPEGAKKMPAFLRRFTAGDGRAYVLVTPTDATIKISDLTGLRLQ